ncbi:6-phosphogluconolactonase [Martiniozyma asiatica (nom. inval.)]|nr:6-phosphogluconolactonase [Martiniozyma asiatica]
MVKVHSYKGSQLPKELADFIITHQNSTLSTKSKFSIAISGGSLIKILASGLLNNSAVEWSKWVIYFSDERLVPLDDEESNYGGFKKAVLDPLAHSGIVGPTVVTINESLVHSTVSTAKDVEATKKTDRKIAEEYQSEIPQDGIDLVLLGCGPDGHTCSLFPGHALLNESHRYVAELSDSPKMPPRRITLTLSYLEKCGTLCFVATGSGKREVMADIFSGGSTLPCAIVNGLKTSGGICWYVDDDAIEGVELKTASD